MAEFIPGSSHEVVDLLSDSEDERLSENEPEFFDAQSMQEFAADFPDLDDPIEGFRAQFDANNRETIDLTGIPDIDVAPSDPIVAYDETLGLNAQSGGWNGDASLVTEAACLQMILDVLPDISVDHVLKTINEKTTDATRTTADCEQIITHFLDGAAYPKEADEAKNRKRKRNNDNDASDYEKDRQDPEVAGYEQDALDLLKDEFLSVPVRHIINVLTEHKTLFKAFNILDEQVHNYRQIATTFSKISRPRIPRGAELILIESGSQLPKELYAAKKKRHTEVAKRRKAKEAEQAEEANLQQAKMNKNALMRDCACCFEEVPLNRMISCNGDTIHFYCVDCPRQQIETQMGQSRCRPTCFGVTDCTGTFSRRQLQQVLSDKTFERLEHMQQMEDLKAAGLDFLSECPFCDFKMECPPVEIDKEFRCQNSKCGKTSCRLCEKESHIPLSCEEAKKDGQITLRHIVEEAMSAALIRYCNQCKHPFVKEMGCNKMTCTHCRNVQCYVCSKNVTDYQHFGEAQRGKCPLHENVEDRHEQEVKKAADEAMAKVHADNPGLSDADLMVKVSDQVKKAEDSRRGRATADANAFPYHMVGDVLRNRVVNPGAGVQPPVPPPPPLFQPPFQPRPLQALMNMLPGNHRWRDNDMAQLEGPAEQPPPPPPPFPALHPNRAQLRIDAAQAEQRLRLVQLQQANQVNRQRAANRHEAMRRQLDAIHEVQRRRRNGEGMANRR